MDVFLTLCPGVLSRSRAQQLIAEDKVMVSGRVRSKNYLLKLGEPVEYEAPELVAPTVEPEAGEIEIVFENSEVVVINKPAGLVVHPAPGNFTGTLVNRLLAKTKLANIGAPLRPGIVHRLDKDTSGLMIAAKTDHAYIELVEQIQTRAMKRRYLALVEGGFSSEGGRVEAPIGRSLRDRRLMAVGAPGAKDAVTNFKVLSSIGKFSLLEVQLDTGRTHQIRVHMKFIKHPIVGDQVYGSSAAQKNLGLFRQWLHSFRLDFNDPLTGGRLSFTQGPPPELTQVLAKVGLEWE